MAIFRQIKNLAKVSRYTVCIYVELEEYHSRIVLDIVWIRACQL